MLKMIAKPKKVDKISNDTGSSISNFHRSSRAALKKSIIDKRTLWIIDIDGTLINVHSNQIPAWNWALNKTYGFVPKESELIKHFGKPFNSVLSGIVGDYKIDIKVLNSGQNKALQTYIKAVNYNLKTSGGQVLPGVIEFLELLGKKGHIKAIATGNPKEEAEYKLKHFDLFKYFDIKVYCDDRKKRSELVSQAIKTARKEFGLSFRKPKYVFVVGDSVHDIESAKHTNATSIAISTGKTSKVDLLKAKPNFLISDFRELHSLIESIS